MRTGRRPDIGTGYAFFRQRKSGMNRISGVIRNLKAWKRAIGFANAVNISCHDAFQLIYDSSNLSAGLTSLCVDKPATVLT